MHDAFTILVFYVFFTSNFVERCPLASKVLKSEKDVDREAPEQHLIRLSIFHSCRWVRSNLVSFDRETNLFPLSLFILNNEWISAVYRLPFFPLWRNGLELRGKGKRLIRKTKVRRKVKRKELRVD